MSEQVSVDVILLSAKYHLLKFTGAYGTRTICGLTPKPHKNGITPEPERINFPALIPQLRCSRCEAIAATLEKKKLRESS